MVESTDHYEAWQKKKTEVQLLVMGMGPYSGPKRTQRNVACPVEIDLVPDIVLEVVVADWNKKVARRNVFRIEDGEEIRQVRR
jgi:hypothetical protein